MTSLARELEMIRLIAMAEHHAIEAVVIPELSKDLEAEAVAIKSNHRVELIGGSRDAEMLRRFHSPATKIISVSAQD